MRFGRASVRQYLRICGTETKAQGCIENLICGGGCFCRARRLCASLPDAEVCGDRLEAVLVAGSSTGASTWPKINDVRMLGDAQGKTAAAELIRARKRKKGPLASGVYRRIGARVWIVGKGLLVRERPSGCRNYYWAAEVVAVADAVSEEVAVSPSAVVEASAVGTMEGAAGKKEKAPRT